MPANATFWLMADDIRGEVRGKVAALGIFANGIIVLHGLPDDVEPSFEKPVVIGALDFLASHSVPKPPSRPVSFKFEVQCLGQNKCVFEKEGVGKVDSDGRLIVLMRFRPFPVFGWGPYQAKISGDGWMTTYNFELRRGLENPDVAAPTDSLPPSRKGAKKKRVVAKSNAKGLSRKQARLKK